MRGELVALDLETTGLDPNSDDIIEIGAVRFEGDRIIDELTVLVKPTRPIPALVTQLTGILPEDVEAAPSITEVLPQLTAFVGNSPWIAHNAAFDGAFLERYRALSGNFRIDTFDLAPILLPQSTRYSLTSLTQLTGFDIQSAHRALYDAKATAHVYWKLWEKLIALPVPIIIEIAAMARSSRWILLPIFEAALNEHGIEGIPAQFERAFAAPTDIFDPPPPEEERRLERTPSEHPISRDTIHALLGENSPLAQALPGFEKRSGQLDMASSIADAFNNAFHLFIEAGTGIGKSMGYLVPAALWAVQNQDRVFISTNTINLQEQLLNHDIPLLQTLFDTPVRAALLKGRSNYLCPRRLIEARRSPPMSSDEARMIAKLLVWLTESKSGDRSEINLRGADEQFSWSRFSAEDSECGGHLCVSAMQGVCPFYKAQRNAENAHLVIINHALLMSNATSAAEFLPSFSRIVMDEGHQLEDAITNALSVKLDEQNIERGLNEAALLLQSMAISLKSGAPSKYADRFASFAQDISAALKDMRALIVRLFVNCRHVVEDAAQRSDSYPQLRVDASVRSSSSFAQAQNTWGKLREFFDIIVQKMREAAVLLRRLSAHPIPDYDSLLKGIDRSADTLLTVHQQLEAFFNAPDANTIYWINQGQHESDYISLHTAPLHIGAILEKAIWSQKSSAVVTSATLQVNGSFEFIQQRLSAEIAGVMSVESPFNYRDSALVFIPSDMPEPADRDRYQQLLERGIIELATALNGRTMVLFTSYAHLRQTAQAITPRLALGDIIVYDQSDGSSRQALLEGFRTSEKAVLLGTKSFWEGVDIPGSALSAVVIPRLPFSPPNDPIFAARSENYADSFNAFALPDAVLRFRQGFGRLIRTQTDRGVVVIMDARIRTKRYGAAFLDALPDCTVQTSPLSALAETAVKWIKPTAN
jgi:DNA polymerase-3 subunit epsilon/ATP-dependent DNA helicase DinG